METKYSTCNLCESMCGIKVELEGEKILAIRGDKEDPFSKGHICPKASALQDIYNDPDRIKFPMKRTESGWKEISWEDALEETAERISGIQSRFGKDSFALYAGNPNVHSLGALIMYGPFTRLLKTKNLYSATSLDQLPHELASLLMFGHQFLLPIPDIDNTNYFLIIGANPLASNGSLMSAADSPKKIENIKKRGGKVVVIDPRFTETAEVANEHHFIRPGTDALFLLAIIHTIYSKNLIRPGRLSGFTDGIEEFRKISEPFSPEKVSSFTGISAKNIESIAIEFSESEKAICYGRMGTSTQEFGTISQWCINVINIITGRLDSPGGVLFTKPAVDAIAVTSFLGEKGSFGKYKTRVRGLPSFSGEFPSSVLAEEILTEGEGQIKGLFTLAGNPVLSSPNGKNLSMALEKLEFMVSLDFYLNETTRHAHIILPPTSPLERSNYHLVFNLLAIRNIAKYDAPVFEKKAGTKHEWEILLELLTKLSLKSQLPWLPVDWSQRFSGLLTEYFTPETVIDLGLRTGPYGKLFDGLSLDKLKENPHGIDLGPLAQCLPERLMTENKRIHLIPVEFQKDVERLSQKFFGPEIKKEASQFLLIGRRNLRSNNSWMHNIEKLHKASNKCTVQIHPLDADKYSIITGEKIRVVSSVGSVEIEAEITEKIMPGVISIPHGWGHDKKGAKLSVALKNPGVSINDLTDPLFIDSLSGNAGFNGLSVRIEKVG